DAADRVRLELDVAARVVALDRVHQAEQPVGDQIALLDVRGKARPQAAGDVLDQRRVGQDQTLPQQRVGALLVLQPDLKGVVVAHRALGCAWACAVFRCRTLTWVYTWVVATDA